MLLPRNERWEAWVFESLDVCTRIGQNHIQTMYTWDSRLGNRQYTVIYGVYTGLARTIHL